MLRSNETYYNITAYQLIDAVDDQDNTTIWGLEHWTEHNAIKEPASPVYTVTYEQALNAYERNVIGMASISVSGIEEMLRDAHETNVYG